MLCDIVDTAGQPWECCPRSFLRDTLRELEQELDARLEASFEHEFQLQRDDAARRCRSRSTRSGSSIRLPRR